MKEVWVLKLDMERVLHRDGEIEDLPLTEEDRVTKGGDSLLCSPRSDHSVNKCQSSIIRGRQALNLAEKGASTLRCLTTT
ncbi:hypothetical protein BHE74_00007392 [Ensete ventricosum]|nr:hypothetical protein BHE74_00007392 [Ensete ventricosum]